jgi:hypothetical protein
VTGENRGWLANGGAGAAARSEDELEVEEETTVLKGPPLYLVNIVSKGFSVFVSPLFTAFTGDGVSVAFKVVKFTVGVGE